MEPCSISVSSGRSSSSSSTSSQPESPGTCGTGYDTTFVPLRYTEVPVFLNAGPALCRRKQIEMASATPMHLQRRQTSAISFRPRLYFHHDDRVRRPPVPVLRGLYAGDAATLVKRYVRTGKVRMELRPITILVRIGHGATPRRRRRPRRTGSGSSPISSTGTRVPSGADT